MTVTQALELLKTAPRSSSKLSAINPSLTQEQAVGIIEKGIDGLKEWNVHDIFEKRVWQCVKNQKRPKYDRVPYDREAL